MRRWRARVGASVVFMAGFLLAHGAVAAESLQCLSCGGLLGTIPAYGITLPTDGRVLLVFDGGGPAECDAARAQAVQLVDPNGATVAVTSTPLTIDGLSALALQPTASLTPGAVYTIQIADDTPALLSAQSIQLWVDSKPAGVPQFPEDATLVGQCLGSGGDGTGLGLALQAGDAPLDLLLQIQAGDTTFFSGFVPSRSATTCAEANPLLADGQEFCALVSIESPTGALSSAQSLCTKLPTCAPASQLNPGTTEETGQDVDCALGGRRPGTGAGLLALTGLLIAVRRRRRLPLPTLGTFTHKETQGITIR
jgi:hypothetical protein